MDWPSSMIPRSLAFHAARGLAEHVEDLREALDLALGLGAMLLESLAQLLRMRGLCHSRQGLQNLPLGVIDVLEGMEEEIVHGLDRHGSAPCRLRNRGMALPW